jgi:hypothetical protein
MKDASIWPFDYLRGDYPVPSPEILIPGIDEPPELHGLDTELRFRCFVLCAFSPAERAEALQRMVQSTVNRVRAELIGRASSGMDPEKVVLTVEMFNYSGAIHADIWRSIRTRDIIIADVSDENPNVMYELGVAAAIKPALQVIIVGAEEQRERIRFDLKPLRHLFYKETLVGDMEFAEKLREALRTAVLSLPFARRPIRSHVILPHRLDLRGVDTDDLLCPNGVHRRVDAAGLEFGGLSYPHSWLCLGNLAVRDVLVRLRVRFLQSFIWPHMPRNAGWVSISLRSSHYLSNHSRLFYLAHDGLSIRAVPDPLSPPKGLFDERVDGVNGFPSFKPGTDWFTLTHGIDSLRFFSHGDPRDGYFTLAEGRVLVQTWMSIIQIESLEALPATNLRSMGTLPPMDTDRKRAFVL